MFDIQFQQKQDINCTNDLLLNAVIDLTNKRQKDIRMIQNLTERLAILEWESGELVVSLTVNSVLMYFCM